MNSTLFSYRCFCVLRSHFFSYRHFPSFLHKLNVKSCSERASVSTVLMRNRGARTQHFGTFDWLAMELHIHSVGLGRCAVFVYFEAQVDHTLLLSILNISMRTLVMFTHKRKGLIIDPLGRMSAMFTSVPVQGIFGMGSVRIAFHPGHAGERRSG